MFALGLFYGRRIFGTKQYCLKIEHSQEVMNRRNKVLAYIKDHPYHICAEIATALDLDIRCTNAILMVLLKGGQIARTQDHKYF